MDFETTRVFLATILFETEQFSLRTVYVTKTRKHTYVYICIQKVKKKDVKNFFLLECE